MLSNRLIGVLIASGLLAWVTPTRAIDTSIQWGANRAVSPWSICLYDSTNTCQSVFTLPGSGGGAPTFIGAVTLPAVTGSTQCLQANSSGVVSGTGSACGSGGGAVTSVGNSDGTLTISPTTGVIVASLALGHANSWSGVQTFGANDLALGGVTGSTQCLHASSSGVVTGTGSD